MGLLDVLKQYSGSVSPQADTPAHFDAVAQQASPDTLGSALSSMFKSSATPPFGQTVGGLFGQSNPDQRAGILNQIIQSMGPAALTAGGGILGKMLGGTPSTGVPTVTPEQASQISPADAAVLASHAEQHNPSVVDTVGSFYAQHPALVKTLGVAALAVVMGHMQNNHA